MSEAGQGQLQNYSVDQVAGAFVLVLSAVSSLLLVLWQSKCLCKMNLCYIFQCERRPPSEEEMKSLKDQVNDRKAKKEEEDKKKKDLETQEQLIPQGQGESPQSPKPKEVIDLDAPEG